MIQIPSSDFRRNLPRSPLSRERWPSATETFKLRNDSRVLLKTQQRGCGFLVTTIPFLHSSKSRINCFCCPWLLLDAPARSAASPVSSAALVRLADPFASALNEKQQNQNTQYAGDDPDQSYVVHSLLSFLSI